MRINKVSDSESFDAYANTLDSFMKKRAGVKDAIKGLGGGIFDYFKQTFDRTMVDSAVQIADDIKGAVSAGDSAKAAGLTTELIRNKAKILQGLEDMAISKGGELAAGSKDKYGISEGLIKAFFGSEENYKAYYTYRALSSMNPRNTNSPLYQLGKNDPDFLKEFDELIKKYHDAFASGPIKQNPELLKDWEAGIKVLNENPEGFKGLFALENIDEFKQAIGPRGMPVPEEAAAALKGGGPEGAKAAEEITEQVQKQSDELGEISQKGQNLDSDLKEGKIDAATHERETSALKERANKIKEWSEATIKTIGEYGSKLLAFSLLKKVALVAAAIAGGAWVYNEYFSGSGSAGPPTYGGARSNAPGTGGGTPGTGGGTPGTGAGGGNTGSVDPVKVAIIRAIKNGDNASIQKIISNPAITDKVLQYIANQYGKDKFIKLPRPVEGMTYVFVDNKIIGDTPRDTAAGLIYEAVTDRKKARPIYDDFKGLEPTPQHALNEVAEEIIGKGLYRKNRARKYLLGKKAPRRKGMGGFDDKDYSREITRGQRRKRSSEVDDSRLQKLSKLKEFSLNSTNNHLNNDTNMLKKADEMSKSYVKDAVKGLNNEDKTLREYFTGLGRLYDAESEKRNPDYKELYELHDETGRELTLSAHPKAIRLSDAKGDGGLVENGYEQKDKMEGVALRTPTGNFESRYAKLKNLLIKSSKT